MKMMHLRDRHVSATNMIKHIIEGNYDAIRKWLENPMNDPSADDNIAIKLCAIKGYNSILILLLKDARVDPAVDDNFAIKYAAIYGNSNNHCKIVHILLGDDRVTSKLSKKYINEFSKIRMLGCIPR